jgi:sarcosine/dimethylglycine N-methyltransferase
MKEPLSLVQEHYRSNDLFDRIMNALAATGHDTANPTVEMFFPLDQLHTGGLNATRAQAELAIVKAGMRVLDAGCGIGGGARFLAHIFGCQVEAIDLTPEYVEAAVRLNALCHLEQKIVVRLGSVTDLPYADQSFDLVWCQNVTMNVADKQRMFAEAFRVLVPGGRYTFSHAAQGPEGEPYYPMPWARESSHSFLGTPEQTITALKDAGFVIAECRVEHSAPQGGTQPVATVGGLGPGIAMGADMPARQANMVRSLKEGRLAFMLVVAERPG